MDNSNHSQPKEKKNDETRLEMRKSTNISENDSTMDETKGHMKNTKSNPQWNPELTQKAQYFRRLLPLLDVERIIFQKDKKELYNHYPKIEIVLKIVDIILDHTSVIADNPYTGISRDKIFSELRIFLNEIDKQYGKNLSKSQQEEFFLRLWETIAPQSKTTHTMESIDLSEVPFNTYRKSFYYLTMERTPDGVILYSIDPLLINIYAKILDIKLEDQQDALKYIMTKKIKEGKYSEALLIAKKDMEMTIQFLISIQKIKAEILRCFSTDKIYPEYREQLESAREHIRNCRRHSEQQFESVQKILIQETLLNARDRQEINELKRLIELSMSKLIIIQEMIQTTRERFLDSQANLFDMFDNIPDASILSQINRVILESSINLKNKLTSELIPFFSAPKCPHIPSLSQIINIKMKRIGIEPKIKKKSRKRREPGKKITSKEILYSIEIRKTALEWLNKILEQKINPTMNEIFSILDKEGVPFLIQDYICLKIQSSFADPKRRVGLRKIYVLLDVSLPPIRLENKFQSKYFQGTNLLVKKIKA